MSSGVILSFLFALFAMPPGAHTLTYAAAAPQRASIVVQNEALRPTLLSLGSRFGANIIVSESVSGSVSVSLHNVTLDEALRAILEPLHYVFVKRDGSYLVSRRAAPSRPAPSPTPALQPVVLNVTLIPVDRAANVLRGLYPKAAIRVDPTSGALIIVAAADDVNGMRAVLQGIDIKNPVMPIVAAIQVQHMNPAVLADRLRPLYPHAQITLAAKQGLLIRATPQDLDQIKQLISTVDQPPTAPSPGPPSNADAVRVIQGRPQDIARTVVHEFSHVRASVAGSAIVLSGDPDEITKAKALIAQIDLPQAGSHFVQVYRLHTVDAGSVADLLTRSFRDAQISVDKDLNALSVLAGSSDQQHIADAVSQLDAPPNATTPGGTAAGGSSLEVVTLRSAIPTQSSNATTTGTDPTQAIIQTLQQLVPNVKVSQLSQPGQLALIGDPYSLRQAKDALVKLDIPAALVVLDTEILQIDESVAKNLGLQAAAFIGTTYSEIPPPPNADGTVQKIGNLLPITRLPASLPVALNLAIQRGSGRVLSDPRLTTLSGHTASIRAGDQISILTTSGGGAGTVTTSQLQTFQTGVTLDITPLVTSDTTVTVTLHPVVNSVDGNNGGVPQISTRETTTTVSLNDNQTLVIGGLIQDSRTRTESRIPVLGNLPLVGALFRNNQITTDHNELVIVVTPHIVQPGEAAPPLPKLPPLPTAPSPEPLPTIPPGTVLPPARSIGQHMRRGRGADVDLHPTSADAAAPTPIVVQDTSTPTPLSSVGVYTYGTLPATNFAKPDDPVKIFQATVGPTTVQNGTPIRVSVVSTTNTNKVAVSYGSTSTTLGQTGPGMWQGILSFSTAAMATGQSNVVLQIAATRIDGAATQITVPLSVSR